MCCQPHNADWRECDIRTLLTCDNRIDPMTTTSLTLQPCPAWTLEPKAKASSQKTKVTDEVFRWLHVSFDCNRREEQPNPPDAYINGKRSINIEQDPRNILINLSRGSAIMITSIARAEWALNNTVDTYHQKHTDEKIAVKCVLRNDHKTTLLKCQSQHFHLYLF